MPRFYSQLLSLAAFFRLYDDVHMHI